MKPKLLEVKTISPFNNKEITIQLKVVFCPRHNANYVLIEKNCRQCVHYSQRLDKDYCSQADK